VIFEKLVQVPVFGCAHERIANGRCSATTTLRDRRDEWIELGVMDALRELALEAYDSSVGLELLDVAVNCYITKTPCGGEKASRSPVDKGKRGTKRSTAVDARGIPLGTVTAPAHRHDSPLLAEPSTRWRRRWEGCPGRTSSHLDRGYDSGTTRQRLQERALSAEISLKGEIAPLGATKRWIVERLLAQAHKKLVWCTERRGRVIDFWVAFSEVVIIVRRRIREGWTRYRWEGRPSRRP
jgi:DDE family transposase